MAAYASGRHAHGFCDICSFRYPLKQLKPLVVNFKKTNTLACPACWNKDHPQYGLNRLRITDPQALKNPRPDTSQAASRVTQWGWNPVGGDRLDVTTNLLEATGEVGDVTITTS